MKLLVLPAALLLAVTAFAQNSGNTAGGASTNNGAGVVTSGTAAPAGQTPKAQDSTLGQQGGGTGAGMGTATAGQPPAKAQADGKQSTKTKKTSSKSKTKAKAKKKPAHKPAA